MSANGSYAARALGAQWWGDAGIRRAIRSRPLTNSVLIHEIPICLPMEPCCIGCRLRYALLRNSSSGLAAPLHYRFYGVLVFWSVVIGHGASFPCTRRPSVRWALHCSSPAWWDTPGPCFRTLWRSGEPCFWSMRAAAIGPLLNVEYHVQCTRPRCPSPYPQTPDTPWVDTTGKPDTASGAFSRGANGGKAL